MLQINHTLGRSVRCHFSVSAGLNRLRSEWRRDRKPANTKLGDEDIIETRKAFGGRSKVKATAISKGQYSLSSKDVEKELRILDVVHSDAGKHYQEQKIIAKGTVIAVEGAGLLSELDVTTLLGEADHQNTKAKEHIENLLKEGTLYAKVTTRPGQVGKCDGYILEGNELVNFIEKIRSENVY